MWMKPFPQAQLTIITLCYCGHADMVTYKNPFMKVICMNGLLSSSLVNGIDQQTYNPPDHSHLLLGDGKPSDLFYIKGYLKWKCKDSNKQHTFFLFFLD